LAWKNSRATLECVKHREASDQEVKVGSLDIGPARLTIIAGPCLAESEELCMTVAAQTQRLCAALGIDLDPAMVNPYQEGRARMTDGIHAEGKMLGDVKFLQYKGVEGQITYALPHGIAYWVSLVRQELAT